MMHRKLDLPVVDESFRIEAGLWGENSAAVGAGTYGIVAPPHPLYGGAMSNKVVYTLASTAGKAGLATLRFNFRGVGKSTGVHDEGRGETEDTVWLAAAWRAAVNARLGHEAPLVLAGFSFGAFVSLWALYGVAYWMEERRKNVAYNVLDLFSKCFVGIFFWAYFTKAIVL